MSTKTFELNKKDTTNKAQTNHLPAIFMLLAMTGAFLLLDAVLPLHGLWFHTALLVPLSHAFLLPTDLLFHGWAISPTLLTSSNTPAPAIGLSWQETAFLLVACLLLLLCYLLALRVLPGRIGRRYLLGSTLLLGALCVIIPVVTSQDLFSYIIYARMAVLYHLNPLSTSPQSIASDPLYAHLYWTNQPSAYGPMWTMITCILQWTTDLFRTNNVAAMVLALRLLGLCAHLFSTLLVWSLAGQLQELRGVSAPKMRVRATLTFAWNPLLLFEACVNAHNDTVLLPFLLLAVWLFVRQARNPTLHSYRTCTGAALLLAAATCIKVNLALLFPAFLLYLWSQPGRPLRRIQSISLLTFLYIACIVALYALFWQNGAILSIVQINPGTYRDINTLSEFLSHFYNSVAALLGAPLAADIGSPAESFTRVLSLLIFAGLYGLCCWRTLSSRARLQTPIGLIRWMALVWLLYCAIGTPWFWPWYTAIFFALFALIESVEAETWHLGLLRLPLAARLLSFSLLSLYCFYTWAPYATMLPGLPGFRWAYLRGLWVWLLPLLFSVRWPLHLGKTRKDSNDLKFERIKE